MRRKTAIIINLFIGIMAYGAWIFMAVLEHGESALTADSFSSLKFYTVLSNLVNGTISLCYVYWMVTGKEITPVKRTWKLMGASAVTLTFLTVMCFLGPVFGFGIMFQGANFWLHLVLPLLSIFSFVFLEQGCKLSLRHILYTVIPTLLYEIGYLGNIIVNGIGEWPDTNDFYGFLSWGYGIGAVIAVGMLFIVWLIALGLYRAAEFKQR